MNFQPQCKDFGYKEVVQYLEGKLSMEEMTEKLKMESRRYAKRQITWFKKNKETHWINGEDKLENNLDIIIRTNIGKFVKWEMI